MKNFVLLTGIFLLAPFAVSAQLEFTEIMYDLEGSDSKREWVEVYNSGTTKVDLSDWRFNDGSNHVFNTPPENGGQGSIVIGPDEYAILAGDAATFLLEYSSISVSVIDTVMSLNNTTDTLQMRDANGSIVAEVSYENTLGAAGDGESLHLIDGDWSADVPTPGSGTQTETGTLPVDDTSDDTIDEEPVEKQQEEVSSSGSTWPVEPQIFAFAGDEKRSTVVGGTIRFSGNALGLKQEPLESAWYVWSFGDGARAEGQKVDHTYRHPGTYVVMLDVSSGKYSATDRIYVTVTDADLIISSHDGYVSVANNGLEEIDLSWWRLSNSTDSYTLPQHTIALAGSIVSFSDEITGLVTSEGDEAILHYPNGNTVEVSVEETSGEIDGGIEEDKKELPEVVEISTEETVASHVITGAPNTSQFMAVADSLDTSLDRARSESAILAQVVEAPVALEKEDTVQASTTQVAQVLVPAQEEGSSVGLWLFGVLGIAFLGVLGTLLIKPTARNNTASEAESYTLIDDTEIDSNR